MATVKSPFPQFFDADGGPLNSGYIYVGTAGQNPETNPITVYWDSALTQPAPQPLRTLNGYIYRGGTPATVYPANSDYSITVRNSRGALVYNAASVNSLADFSIDLAAAIHAAPLDADPSELDEIGIWDQATGLLRKITFTFLQSGAGAVLMKIRTALRLTIWAEHYGASTAATAAVNDAAFAAAIAEASARGGDIVNFGPGVFNFTQIVLKTGVHVIGRGSSASKLFQAAASNKAAVITENFAALTGTNAWLTTENVPYGFGLDAMTIDGNKANQLSGNGVSIYGKGYAIGFDLKIVHAKDIAFYSECGYKGGQNVEQDMPEGNIGKVQTYESGKEGFVYRGPHDQPIHDVSVSRAGMDGIYHGVLFEGQINVYNGATYITGSIHSYAATGSGIRLRTHVLANQLTGENNEQDGVVFEAPGETVGMIGGTFATADLVEAYGNDNNNTGLYWGIRTSGASNKLLNLRVSTSGQAAGGVYNNGNFNMLAGTITGASAVANGIGFKNEANYVHTDLIIQSFNQVGDVGLVTQTGAYCHLGATIYNCTTAWLNNAASSFNQYRITAFAAAGTPFTQAGTFAATDSFDVTMNHGTAKLSHYNGNDTSILVGNTAVTLTHNGFITPKASDLTITPTMNWNSTITDSGADTHSQPRACWISNITATTFDVNTDVAAPVGGLTFSWEMNI